MPQIKIKVEVGVKGYHAQYVEMEDTALYRLVERLKVLVDQWAGRLEESEDANGDLREFAPAFADGYPTLSGLGMAELGEDFDVSLLEMSIDGQDLDHNDSKFLKIIDDASLNG